MVPEVERHKFMEHKGLSIDGDKGGESMKRKMLSIALLAMLALGFSAKASAKDIAIDKTNFPDPGLREYVQTAYDTNKDGVLSDEENAAAKEMEVYFNEDPTLMISIREDNTDYYYDLGKWTVHKEFPCDQIAENPMNSIKPDHNTYGLYYIVGSYPWKCVINQPVKSWKGLEKLTSLIQMTIGGAVPKKLEIKGLPALYDLTIGGDTSDFVSVSVKKCPRFRYFDFARTNKLKKIVLSKGLKKLEDISQREFWDSSISGQYNSRKKPEIIIGETSSLERINIWQKPIKKLRVKYSSLKKLQEMTLLMDKPKEEIDLSACKQLYSLTILGKYRKIILPNQKLYSAQGAGRHDDWMYEFETIISFDSKNGPKILDLSKSTRARDYADEYIFSELMRKLKEGKVRTKTLVVSRKMYEKRRNTLRLLRKKGINVQVK